jgi:hypothetical protein
MGNNEMPDAEQVRDIMKVVSETIPDLVQNLAMYKAKESEELGKAVGSMGEERSRGG